MNKLYFLISLCIILILKFNIFRTIAYAYHFKYKNNLKIDSFMPYAYLYSEIFNDNSYNFEVKDNMTIFDVGANIGIFNLYVNSKAKNLNVYSFEPVPQIFECLNSNASKYKNSICINKGLGDKNEIVTMNYLKNASGMSSIKDFDNVKIKAHDKIYKQECGIFHNLCKYVVNKEMQNPVKVKGVITTASDIIDQYQIKDIDVMKIDVEGFELNVLKGIRDEHFSIIKKIFIEIENFRKDNNKNEIYQILDKHNYVYKIIDGNDDWIMVEADQIFV